VVLDGGDVLLVELPRLDRAGEVAGEGLVEFAGVDYHRPVEGR
jgi:hypothetical protein